MTNKLIIFIFTCLVASCNGGVLFKYQFSTCASTYLESTGRGPSLVMGTGAQCVSKTLTGAGTMNGIQAVDCPTPNTLVTGQFGPHTFRSYRFGNVNLTAEVWFSVPVGTYPDLYGAYLFEVSTIQSFMPRRSVSFSRQANQIEFGVGRNVSAFNASQLFASGFFSYAVLYDQAQMCDSATALSLFASSESSGYQAKLMSVGSDSTRLYKFVMSITQGSPTYYLATGDDPFTLEYSPAITLSELSLLQDLIPNRVKIYDDSVLRLGCSADPSIPPFPVIYHKVAMYDKGLNTSEILSAFNT